MLCGNRGSKKGAILFEAAFTAFVWGVLVAGMHLAVIKFWNAQLEKLDAERLKYDGIRP